MLSLCANFPPVHAVHVVDVVTHSEQSPVQAMQEKKYKLAIPPTDMSLIYYIYCYAVNTSYRYSIYVPKNHSIARCAQVFSDFEFILNAT